MTAGTLQPFQPLMLSWQGRSSLKNLTHVEVPSKALVLANERLFCGYYLNELSLMLLPVQQAFPAFFALYIEAIKRLALGDAAEYVLRHFEFEILNDLGLLPSFETDIEGDTILDHQRYSFVPEQGFVKVEYNDHQNIMRYEGRTLRAFTSRQFAGGESATNQDDFNVILKQAKVLMRYLVDIAVNHRKINSRELFAQIKQGG